MNAGHHLLFGLLALENRFVDNAELIAALQVWITDHDKPLDHFLVYGGLITEDERVLLAQLVDRQLAAQGGDVTLSVQALTRIASVGGGHEPLADSTFRANLETLGTPKIASSISDGDLPSSTSQRFEILRPLDRGGLGIVSVALDKELHREVAVKEIRSDCADDPLYREKFFFEAEVTGGLEHPGIVPVYSFGKRENGRPYYAMRLIKGDNLSSHIKQFHQSVAAGEAPYDGTELRKLLRRLLDVCNAIEYAHTRGVLHRDLKPRNIMLGQFGETLVVDWGLAKPRGTRRHGADYETLDDGSLVDGMDLEPWLIPSSDGLTATVQGSAVGTAAYASPEQLAGKSGTVDERSDIYGLGSILYEVLTGKPPARGRTIEEISKSALTGDIARPRQLESRVPKALEAVCLRALSHSPSARYGSAFQLSRDIERWLDGLPVDAMPEPWTTRTQRWMRNHVAIVATLAVGVIMSTIGLGLFSSIVSQNHDRLAALNQQLDLRNSELDRRNLELDEKNSLLVLGNQRESSARIQAEKQSQITLSTLTSIVEDVQLSLKDLPGAADIRRQLLTLAISQLENMGADFGNQSGIDRTSLLALISLGDVVLRFESDPKKTANAGTEDDGAVKAARGLYDQAFRIAEKLLEETPNSPKARLDLAKCSEKLGDVSLQSGNSAAALDFYLRTVEAVETVAAESPDDESIQRELSISFVRLGDLYLTSGNNKDALLYYEKCLAVRERLAALNPGNAQAILDLAEVYRGIGDKNLRSGEVASALGYFEKCYGITKKLAQEQPDSEKVKRAIANSYIKLGDVYQRIGKANESEELYKAVLRIRIELAKSEPDNIPAQRNVSVAYNRLGVISRESFQPDVAIEYFEKALEIAERLVSIDKGNAQFKIELSNLYSEIGDACLDLNFFARALTYFEKAFAIRQALAEADPGNHRTQNDLAYAHEKIGDAMSQASDWENALFQYSKAFEIRQNHVQESPDDATEKRQLAISATRIGDMNLQLGQTQDAAKAYGQAFDLRMSHAKFHPLDTMGQRDLSLAYNKQGDVALAANQATQALALYETGLKIRLDLAINDPKNSQLQRDISFSYRKLGDAYLQIGDREQSFGQYVNAKQALERLILAKPTDYVSQNQLVTIYLSFADWYQSGADTPAALACCEESIEALNHLVSNGFKVPILKQEIDDLEQKQAELKLGTDGVTLNRAGH